MIIRGSNQHERVSSGADKGSEPIVKDRLDQPGVCPTFSHERLSSAIAKLWARVVGQSHLVFRAQVVGIIITVGARIFSIGGG